MSTVYARTYDVNHIGQAAGPAGDAALIGRYVEYFADHAMAITRQVFGLAPERIPEPALNRS